MSLQGTLDTFALTELVRMLASTSKTGELTIEGDRGVGRLWFVDGALVAGEPTRSGSVVDAIFELLRFEEGAFAFEPDTAAAAPGDPVDAGEALAAAEADLEAWRPVEALVPSSSAVVTLRGEIQGEAVTIDQTTWRHLVAIGSGTTAGGFGVLLDLDDIGAAVRIKELHDAGLVTVDPDAPPRSTAPDPVDFAPEPVDAAPERHDHLGGPEVEVAAAGGLADVARDMAEVDALASSPEPVAFDDAPEPEVAEEPEPLSVVASVEEPTPAPEPHVESELADVDLGTAASGSTAVDLDSHLGASTTGHSYLDAGSGSEVLPEPLLAVEAPAEAPAPVEDLFASDDAPESSWPGPAMDEDDLAAQLGALSPAAARAVQAASNGEPSEDDDTRGVVRRIISSNRS